MLGGSVVREGGSITDRHTDNILLRASERSERSEHIVVLSLRFYYIYIYYSVTKILRKIRATTFTENYGKLRVRGMSA